MTKIIVLRGNSGSGKSSVAREIQAKVSPHPVLIEQDHFRRKILREKESPDILNDALIIENVRFALANNRNVIIEGIFPFAHMHDKYRRMFDTIFSMHPTENYVYYFDIPLKETFRRHATKPNAHEFGENEMRRWYKDDDRSMYPGEIVIGAHSSFDDTVAQIITESGLQIKPAER